MLLPPQGGGQGAGEEQIQKKKQGHVTQPCTSASISNHAKHELVFLICYMLNSIFREMNNDDLDREQRELVLALIMELKDAWLQIKAERERCRM